MATWEQIRNDVDGLRAYLDSVDARLAGEGIAIHARAFHAWLAVQREMQISVSLGHPSVKPVDDYFGEKYGRRSLWDPSVGRMLVMFGHEAWVLRFPLVEGRMRVELLSMIEDGTPDVLARLTDAERALLERRVPQAFDAFNSLRQVPLDLRADWSTAVDQAVDPRGDMGLSKWSSQQVVEKMLKHYISMRVADVPRELRYGHELAPLAHAAEVLGLGRVDQALLADVECRAGIRYPGNTATLQDAVAANQASVLICGELGKQW